MRSLETELRRLDCSLGLAAGARDSGRDEERLEGGRVPGSDVRCGSGAGACTANVGGLPYSGGLPSSIPVTLGERPVRAVGIGIAGDGALRRGSPRGIGAGSTAWAISPSSAVGPSSALDRYGASGAWPRGAVRRLQERCGGPVGRLGAIGPTEGERAEPSVALRLGCPPWERLAKPGPSGER